MRPVTSASEPRALNVGNKTVEFEILSDVHFISGVVQQVQCCSQERRTRANSKIRGSVFVPTGSVIFPNECKQPVKPKGVPTDELRIYNVYPDVRSLPGNQTIGNEGPHTNRIQK